MPQHGFVLAHPYPHSRTAVIFGDLPKNTGNLFTELSASLWICDQPTPEAQHLLPEHTRVLPLNALTKPTLIIALDELIRLDPRRLPSLFSSADSPWLAEAHAHLESQHRARVTRQRDGFTWQKNLLSSLPLSVRQPLPSAWQNAFAGQPAFVCGAGPSLDVTAPALAAHAEHAIVFSADSALRTLARHRITADFVVSVDAAKLPTNCLPEGRIPARAVLSPVSPPEWLQAMQKKQLHFASSRQVTSDWLVSRGATKPALAVAENCGATALELARFLGCAPIFLIGMDLALAPDQPTQRHTADADQGQYTQSGFDATQDYPHVPGNWHESVPTHVIGDWRALDERLARWPVGLVTNLTDRGARLRNTTVIHPADFKWPCFTTPLSRPLNLPEAEAFDEITTAQALAGLRTVLTAESGTPARLRKTLQTGGPEAVANALRQQLAQGQLARALGGYALKLMPHLFPPIEGDAIFWSGLVDEFATLVQLAPDLR